MSKTKEDVIGWIRELPDDCTAEDILYRLYVRVKVQEGVNALDQGRVVSHEEAKRRMSEWLASSGPTQP
jgi:hypothetical protein